MQFNRSRADSLALFIRFISSNIYIKFFVKIIYHSEVIDALVPPPVCQGGARVFPQMFMCVCVVHTCHTLKVVGVVVSKW